MKIILVTRLFAPEVAAASFRLKALADGLATDGHEVTVLTTRPPETAPAAADTRYRVSRWPVLRDVGGNVRGYVQYASYDVPLLARLLVRSADVVVCEPPPTTGVVTAVGCLLKRTPYYYYAADVWSDALVAMGAPGFVSGIMRSLERFALRRARGVVAVSEGVAERVRGLGVAGEKIEVVENGTDTESFRPMPEGAASENPYFVYTGTMSEWQGADIFLRALPIVLDKHPDVRLKYLGQGADEPRLRSLADEIAPGTVDFGGVVPPADAARWIGGARCALVSIVPGKGYDFAKPTKIYSAAACGTPVLFAGQGASRELIDGNELGLTADYTPESVAAAMIAMLDSYENDATHLVGWVAENASLARSGKHAARWIAGHARSSAAR